MKFFGNIDLQKNLLKSAVMEPNSEFPANPKIGMLAFVNLTLFICIDVSGDPTWVPLTREMSMYQESYSGSSWTVEHNLNSTSVVVSIFDQQNKIIIPDEIEILTNNSIQVSFSDVVTGRVVVMSGSLSGATKDTVGFIFEQTTASTTWTINHNLGYLPVVRVVVNGYEVQPASIQHVSNFSCVVTFNSPTSGSARFI